MHRLMKKVAFWDTLMYIVHCTMYIVDEMDIKVGYIIQNIIFNRWEYFSSRKSYNPRIIYENLKEQSDEIQGILQT